MQVGLCGFQNMKYAYVEHGEYISWHKLYLSMCYYSMELKYNYI